ncbi:deacetylase [Paludibacterium yongneupense]|uniref:deacetylase n=1 Tax=Paludibacterium yongneupense TaxID=400061 RepID=UPI0003FC1B0B|nr:deacetylase [Paludibacterium yongneupense]
MNTIPFLITIDTEGDNLWQSNAEISARNARFLPRFQSLCEEHGFKPCYLTNYEMASDPDYQAFARSAIAGGNAEVGMHLHAWNSPPAHPATDRGGKAQAYLIEYPRAAMQAKIDFMTKLLEDTFGVKMLSHRAGRWAFNEVYAELLLEYGYRIDCSVTPHVDWSGTPGATAGGSDYRRFPDRAYFVDPADISKAGDSPLLEVPMTTRPKYPGWVQALKTGADRLRGKRRPASIVWMRPRGGNARQMIALAEQRLAAGADYIEFMLHSSEFMPGGSPTFRDEAAIEGLYADLDELFRYLAPRCEGLTLADYHRRLTRGADRS